MKKLTDMGWINSRKFRVAIYQESEQLSEVMDHLHDTLLDSTKSMDLMSHILEAMCSAWRVREEHDCFKGGWSKLRTFELLKTEDGPVIATLLAYADSHGGMSLELVVDLDDRYALSQALDSFLIAQTPKASIALYHSANIQ